MNRSAIWIAGILLVLAGILVWVSNPDRGDEHGVKDDTRSGSFGRVSANPPVGSQSHDRSKRARDRSAHSGIDGNSSNLGEAYEAIRSQGDYRGLRMILQGMSPVERISVLYQEFPTLRSRLGNRYDLDEKLAIAAEYGGTRAPDIRTRVIKSTGALLDAEADKEFIKSLDEEVWIIMVSGAVQTNAPKAFELATWEIGEAYRRVACGEAARMWMVLDPMAASKRIGEMPRSSLKDVAVVEMVNHILSKDGAEAAKAWLGEISDPAIRKRMALRFNEH